MDRSFTGLFTVGGRGSNRSFHGKVASCVVSTLKTNFDMPSDAEKKMIITDPMKWWQDYMVGETGRRPDAYGTTHVNATNNQNSARSTQIWLMGDGVSDAYALMRNQCMLAIKMSHHSGWYLWFLMIFRTLTSMALAKGDLNGRFQR